MMLHLVYISFIELMSVSITTTSEQVNKFMLTIYEIDIIIIYVIML